MDASGCANYLPPGLYVGDGWSSFDFLDYKMIYQTKNQEMQTVGEGETLKYKRLQLKRTSLCNMLSDHVRGQKCQKATLDGGVESRFS